MWRLTSELVFVTVLTVTVVECLSGGQPTHVDVSGLGRVNGLSYRLQKGSVDVFLGIPFAKPPIRQLRFQPPLPLDGPWNGEYNATRLPAACYQIRDKKFDKRLVDMWNPNVELSEDCLYLNVWKPSTAKANATEKAVMVWIYGGGFTTGTSTLDVYDATVLSSLGDVIVVSMQYRLGPLGFLAFGDQSAPGNVGLLDQQLALTWVHQHIAAFGGDPDRVTLFGESAGAASVSYQLLSPGSKNLFRAAILQSASAIAPWAFIERDKAIENAKSLAKMFGCSSVDCLRQQDAMKLTEMQWELDVDGVAVTSAFVPTVDGKFIPKAPSVLLQSAEFQHKDILIGVVKDEGGYFLPYLFPEQLPVTKPMNLTEDELEAMVKQLNIVPDELVDLIVFEYSNPCESDDRHRSRIDILDDILGDHEFKCPVVKFANSFAHRSAVDNHSIHVYEFSHRTSGNPWPEWFGQVLHGYEIDHVFGQPLHPDKRASYREDERALSTQIIKYWTNFAKTGDPNVDDKGGSRPDVKWPEYKTNDPKRLVFETRGRLETKEGLRERQCQFWNDVLPSLRIAVTDGGVSTHCTGFVHILLLTFTLVITNKFF